MADEEKVQVTLNGKNHLRALCDGLWDFFNEEYMVDITVTCHGKHLKVHRLILALFSPILKDSLLASSGEEVEESKEGKGSIEDRRRRQQQPPPRRPPQQQQHHALNLDYVSDEGSYVQYLIEFLYQGKVTLPRDCLDSLLHTAEVLAVSSLADAIRDYRLNEDEGGKEEAASAAKTGRVTPKEEPVVEDETTNKRKRKRKPVKVTKVLDDEDVCGYGQRQRHADGARLQPEPRMTRRSSLRAQELARAYAECSPEWPNKTSPPPPETSDGDYESLPSYVAVYDEDHDTRAFEDRDDDDENEADDVVGEAEEDREEEGEEEQKHDDVEEVERRSSEGGGRVEKRRVAKRLPKQLSKRRRQQQRRAPRDQQQSGKSRGHSEQGEKQSSTKEYRKLWRQTRPVMKCDICSYETRDKTSFNSHLARHDPSAERFVCEICSKTFRSKKGIRCHRLSHSGPERLHKCTHCDFHTPQKWNWLQHLAVIHKVDPSGNPLSENIKCPQCDFVCVANHQLKAHLLRKHTVDKPFKCQQCDYSTVIKHELEKHVGIRHQNERRYMCESCGFRSQTQGGLTRHKRSHTGVKPFKCDLCGMCYADRGKLKIHLLRHTSDEKPFVCHVCGHACRRRDNLRMHLKRIHGANLESESGRGQGPNVAPLPPTTTFKREQPQHFPAHQLLDMEHSAAAQHLSNVHVEHLSIIHSVPGALQCGGSEGCLRVVHDDGCLQGTRDDPCSVLQAVTGALDCANGSNHMQEVQCSVLHILPTVVP